MHCTVFVSVVLCARAIDGTRCFLLDTATVRTQLRRPRTRTQQNPAYDTTHKACFKWLNIMQRTHCFFCMQCMWCVLPSLMLASCSLADQSLTLMSCQLS